MIDGLLKRRAPHCGFVAQLLRAALDSALLYLPLFLLGRVPPTPSYVSFLGTERYYLTLVWLSPLVLTSVWLFGGAFIHFVLRLSGRRSDVDQILNVTGMAALVVGSVLLVWDWIWIAVGGVDQIFLGITHLMIDVWAVVIIVTGMKKLFGTPNWLAILLAIGSILVSLPIAIMFMRSPV